MIRSKARLGPETFPNATTHMRAIGGERPVDDVGGRIVIAAKELQVKRRTKTN